MKLFMGYMPPNWNKYIDLERGNKYEANHLKQEEKRIVRLLTRGKRYTGKYPVEVIVRPRYNAYRQDLDNFRYKGLLDGLVSAGVLKNDNLRHIQKITLEPIFDDKVGVEIEIKELGL
jgi:Holliday junction resolvase RusA-like endonuclease